MTRYIGLISGTSMDGIDAVLVDFVDKRPKVLAQKIIPFSEQIAQKLKMLYEAEKPSFESVALCDQMLGKAFAQAALDLLVDTDFKPEEIKAIGCHGQTISHQPKGKHPYTAQIGDPNQITTLTGITTVADFRRADMAQGGQGAPFAPALHQYLFRDQRKDRCVINIGGIINVTLLFADKNKPMLGFDTGPGNALLDQWCCYHNDQPFDENGKWAATGQVCEPLLDLLLQDAFFAQLPPKSICKKYFNLTWLQSKLSDLPFNVSAADVQATLVELTVLSLLKSLRLQFDKTAELIICGGGVHNDFLLERLEKNSPYMALKTTQEFGYSPDFVEAILFAYLAKSTIEGLPGELSNVTGAKSNAILGGIYLASGQKP